MSNTKSLTLTKILIIIYVNKRKYPKYKQLYTTTTTTMIVVSITIMIIIIIIIIIIMKQIYVNIHNMNLLLDIVFNILFFFKRQLYVKNCWCQECFIAIHGHRAEFELSVSRSRNVIYFFIIAMPKKSHFTILMIQNFV